MAERFSLFEWLEDPGVKRRGRPRSVATPEDRNIIKVLLATGATDAEMMAAVRMSEKTFRRIFAVELKERHAQRIRLKARRLIKLVEAVEAGNVSANRELGRIIAAQDLIDVNRDITSRQKNRLDDGATVGKKAQAKAAGQAIGQDGQGRFGGLLDPATPMTGKAN